MSISRRKFIKNLGATAIAAPLASSAMGAFLPAQLEEPLEVHLFSKHLHFLDIKEAAQMASELGFAGLDLTVRPKGHVLPENVESDLPVAIRNIEQEGSTCKLITTAITEINAPNDLAIIKTAAEGGVQFYRCDWFRYHKDRSMPESIHFYQQKVKELGEANKQHGIVGCYQNHAGKKIGASYWEVKQLLEAVDPAYFGTQYDIRHALAEGGVSWENGLRLLHDSVKTIVLKDFRWGKVEGRWKIVNVPIGEGMVDFITYFQHLKAYGLKPPVSLHLEYPLGGAEKGRSEITVDRKMVFDAMQKDLATIQHLWATA